MRESPYLFLLCKLGAIAMGDPKLTVWNRFILQFRRSRLTRFLLRDIRFDAQ